MKKILLVLAFLMCFPVILHAEQITLEANTKVDVNFSPKGGIEASIVNLINNTHDTMYISIYSFTNKNIIASIFNAAKRGVKISIVLDESSVRDETLVTNLKNVGVELYLDDKVAIHHDKFVVCDMQYIGTGSFNWSANAQKNNRENYAIFDSKILSKVYYDQFMKMIPLCKKL